MAVVTHKLAAQIEALAKPLVETLGLEIWGVEYAVGKRILVRVFLDAPAAQTLALDHIDGSALDVPQTAGDSPDDAIGHVFDPALQTTGMVGAQAVSIDQCTRVSRHLSVVLEAEDLIPGAYTLEVSSPGLERPFFSAGQLCRFIGAEVEATLYRPVVAAFPGRKCFTGQIQSVEGARVTLLVDGLPVAFDWDEVKRLHLLYRFLDSQDKKSGTKKETKRKT